MLNSAYSGGADNTGSAFSDAAFAAAAAALPASGGVIRLPYGTYKTNTTWTITQGRVTILADPGTVLNYYGSGDCIRMYTTANASPSQWGGGVKGLVIDGTNASAGACGLHIGDNEQYDLDVWIFNFTGTGAIGAHLDNQYWWTEKLHGTIRARNCTSHVVFDVTSPAGGSYTATNASPCVFTCSSPTFANGTQVVLSGGTAPTGFTNGTGYFVVNASGSTFQLSATSGGTAINSSSTGSGTVAQASATNSFGYLDLTCYVYSQANQDGVVVQNGAYPYHGSLVVKGNFQGSASAVSNAILRVTGTVPAGHPSAGLGSAIGRSHLDIQAETQTAANQPSTVVFGSVPTNSILGCYGIMDFTQGSGSFAGSNILVSANASTFTFEGPIIGDSNLGGTFGAGAGMATVGTKIFAKSFMSGANGNTFAQYGDFFAATLSANITVNLAPGGAPTHVQPQRKTFAFTQAAAGGPFTVTWPSTGSPSNTSPTVVWPNGTAPLMPSAASALLFVNLVTFDGVTWYGEQVNPPQVVSGQFLCAPSSYAPGTQTSVSVSSTTFAAFSSANISTGSFTAPPSGQVLVSTSFVAQSTPGDFAALALAAHGTVTPVMSNVVEYQDAGASATPRPYCVQFLVTGLTAGTSYNLDLLGACTSGASNLTILAYGQSAATPTTNRGAPVIMTVQAA